MNLFNGESGISDGSADGVSAEITGDGSRLNIYVAGVFDSASITLQRFSEHLSDFGDTSAIWTQPDEYQGLTVKPGERYRLIIDSAGGSTNLFAEVV